MKDDLATGKAPNPQKKKCESNHQNKPQSKLLWKHIAPQQRAALQNITFIHFFSGLFCPSSIRIRIPNEDPDQVDQNQYGSMRIQIWIHNTDFNSGEHNNCKFSKKTLTGNGEENQDCFLPVPCYRIFHWQGILNASFYHYRKRIQGNENCSNLNAFSSRIRLCCNSALDKKPQLPYPIQWETALKNPTHYTTLPLPRN